jgi:hypothetical protein
MQRISRREMLAQLGMGLGAATVLPLSAPVRAREKRSAPSSPGSFRLTRMDRAHWKHARIDTSTADSQGR